MQDKNLNNVNGNKDPRFLFNPETIRLWSHLEGYDNVDEKCFKLLAEDLSYRLLEVTDYAVGFMRHSKRSRMKVDDLDLAFEVYKTEKIFGHSSAETACKYEKVDLNSKYKNLYRIKDERVKLEMPNDQYIHVADYPDLHNYWIVVNGHCKVSLDESERDSLDLDEYNELQNKLSVDYKQYLDVMTSVILNDEIGDGNEDEEEENDELFKTALEDLQRNPNLQPLLSYLLNFISQTIQSLLLFDEKPSLEKFETHVDYIKRVLDTIRCVLLNKHLFLAPKCYLSKLLSCLLYCMMQPIAVPANRHFIIVRESSAYLLALFLKLNEAYLTDNIDYVKQKFFRSNFKTSDSADHSMMYAVISSLYYLGPKVIDEFYSMIIDYANKLDEVQLEETFYKTAALNACLNCLIKYFKWLLKSKQKTNLSEKYTQISNTFGDKFTLYQIHDEYPTIHKFTSKLKFAKKQNKIQSNPPSSTQSQNPNQFFENFKLIEKKKSKIFIYLKK